jgi:hypothetical protein
MLQATKSMLQIRSTLGVCYEKLDDVGKLDLK